MPILNDLLDVQKQVAVEQANGHPQTIEPPSQRQLGTLREGDFVKISRRGEHFWIRLFRVNGTTLDGKVLHWLHRNRDDLPPQTAVTVETRHVIQIHELRHSRNNEPPPV